MLIASAVYWTGRARKASGHESLAKTLVAFEFLWYKAWVQAIDQAKTGLQATLIIRHPEDNKLYVNFDHEILQLIREAKCLDRMRIEIPESSKIVLFQVRQLNCCYWLDSFFKCLSPFNSPERFPFLRLLLLSIEGSKI